MHNLVLTYLLIEGSVSRQDLANMLWWGLRQSYNKRGELRTLDNLSQALKKLKEFAGVSHMRDFIISDRKNGTIHLNEQFIVKCDVLEFQELIDNKQFTEALTFYENRGHFLEGVEREFQRLFPEHFQKDDGIVPWILDRRRHYHDLFLKAKVYLSKDTIYSSGSHQEQLAPLHLSSLYQASETEKERKDICALAEQRLLFLASKSKVAAQAFNVLKVFTLQEEPDPHIAQKVLGLKARAKDDALSELYGSGWIELDKDIKVIGKNILQAWFNEPKHRSEKLNLLFKLAEFTPTFYIYKGIYEHTQNFGGIGHFNKAKQAYLQEAKRLIDNNQAALSTSILSELQNAEKLLDINSDPEVVFLLAYALERSGEYPKALEVLSDVSLEKSRRALSLQSKLLWRTGNELAAEALALEVLKANLNSPKDKQAFWALAEAENTLGDIHFIGRQAYDEAIGHYLRAAEWWHHAGEHHRWYGARNNVAACYDRAEAFDQAAKEYENIAFKTKAIMQKIRATFNMVSMWAEYGLKPDSEIESRFNEVIELISSQSAKSELAVAARLNRGLFYKDRERFTEARADLVAAREMATEIHHIIYQGVAAAEVTLLEGELEGLEVALNLLKDSEEQLKYFVPKCQSLFTEQIEKAQSKENLQRLKYLQKRHNQFKHTYKTYLDNIASF